MRGMGLCVYLALLLVMSALCQRRGLGYPREQPEEEGDGDLMPIDVLNKSGILGSLLAPEYQPVVRGSRSQRPAPLAPKRSPQGSRFALSLDVPTSILSALIDLAKNHEMRTKAAANAELMARIGKRK
ncbi:urocortin-3-like [Megalops cyprinoides]|uniref:urocortin-3-like n=1 Tax=Megalops cyprinoides TaxID=118141 RepID=UPI001864D066|nr:urocortin-3-like [Megalops cyprinoides]